MFKTLTVNFFICLFVIVSVFSQAQAQQRCSQLFHDRTAGQIEKAIKLWLKWEISPTVEGWSQERPQSALPTTRVRTSSVEIETLSDKDVEGLENILDLSKTKIPWFQHPYNQDQYVPHQANKPNRFFVAFHTASRTVMTKIFGRRVSVKMATDFPFGPNSDRQASKTNLGADLKYSVARSKAIAEIDEKIGDDPLLLIQKEIAAVIDKKTRNGYLFRDMTPLEDGNYYLPGHQLPYIGKELAEANGQTVAEYWQKHWAGPIGQLQAKLLIRYGMKVRAVNPQNFLIQLDQEFKPTGVLIWRDLAESHLIRNVADAVGLKKYIQRDDSKGNWGVEDYAGVDDYYIAWRFNDSKPTLTDAEYENWRIAAREAYRKELEKELGMSISSETFIKFLYDQSSATAESSELIQKIKEWHQKKENQKSKARIGA